jgi:hypothetical protein
MCWSCGRIANAATGTSTRHPRTCLSARTSAPDAGTARRMSCTGSVRTAAASSSGAPSARPACSKSTPHRPSELSGQDALRHPPADPPIGEQEPSRPASSPSGTGQVAHTSIVGISATCRILRSLINQCRASRRGCLASAADLTLAARPPHAGPRGQAQMSDRAPGGIDLANAVANNEPGRARTTLERPNRRGARRGGGDHPLNELQKSILAATHKLRSDGHPTDAP